MVSATTRLSPPIHCPHQQPSRLPVENSLRAIQINYNPRFDNPGADRRCRDRQKQWAPMRVFHRTSVNIAKSIFREGFRDTGGIYMPASGWDGVWVSDIPLEADECG
jgi:hypothetical protein